MEARPSRTWGAGFRFAVAVLFASLATGHAFPKIADDFIYFFNPWIDQIRSFGVAAANPGNFLAYTPSNLYPLWLVLRVSEAVGIALSNLAVLKIATIGGALALAGSAAWLARARGADRRTVAWSVLAVYLTPTVFLNAVRWGQFDAFYVAGLLLATAAVARDRVPTGAFWFGIALSFKAQSFFALPALGMLGAVSLYRRRDLIGAALAPVAFLSALLLATFPATISGFPWDGIARVYVSQPGAFRALTMNAPSIWSLFPHLDYARWSSIGVGLGLFAAFSLGAEVLVAASRRPAGRLAVAERVLLSVVVTAFILPEMHERYFLAAEALATVILVLRKDRISFGIWILLQLASLRTYSTYLYEWGPPPFPVLVAMMVGAIVLAVRAVAARDREIK
jgi:Gpi18-like mannosyltransferase